MNKLDLPQSFSELMISSIDKGNSPRFHGNGMIQLPLSEKTRLHVYHPAMPPKVQNAQIHDHCWPMWSRVLHGRLSQRMYSEATYPEGGYQISQPVVEGWHTWLYRYKPRMVGSQEMVAGVKYYLPARQFHEVEAHGMTITHVVKGERIDDDSVAKALPRILHPYGAEPDDAYAERDDISDGDLWQCIREAYDAMGRDI